MNEEFRKQLGNNKYLLGASVLLIAAGLVFGYSGGSDVESEVTEDVVAIPDVVDPESPIAQSLNEGFVEPRVLSVSEDEPSVVRDLVAEVDQLDDGPELERALNRLANLYYSTVRDYKTAAFYYDRLINEYPKGQYVRTAYVNLADSYFRLNEVEREIATYNAALDAFPEEDSLHQWARKGLDGQL